MGDGMLGKRSEEQERPSSALTAGQEGPGV